MTDPAIDDRLHRIRAKLDEVVRCRLTPFGSEKHGFRLGPVAKESDVVAVERSCGVTLPADYRTFIMQLGDGGTGPAYGLLTLTKGLDYDVESKDPTRLRTPFPYTTLHDAK